MSDDFQNVKYANKKIKQLESKLQAAREFISGLANADSDYNAANLPSSAEELLEQLEMAKDIIGDYNENVDYYESELASSWFAMRARAGAFLSTEYIKDTRLL